MDSNGFNSDCNGSTNGQTCLPAGNENNEVAQSRSLNPNKLQEGNSWLYPKKPMTDKPIQKRPFLKKGTGIARYYGGKVPGSTPKTPGSTTEALTRTAPIVDPKSLPEAGNNEYNDKVAKSRKPPISVGKSMSDHDNVVVGQDRIDFRGGLSLRNGHNAPSQHLHEQEHLDDDPYLEMDSSFTESESQLRDSSIEDEEPEDKNVPNMAAANSSKVELLSPLRAMRNSQEDLTGKMNDQDIEDEEELKIFELMEKISEQPNLGTNAAVVNEFMNTRLNLSPTPQNSNHGSSDGSTPRALSISNMNSYSLTSLASSSSTRSESPDAIPSNILERVLEQVRTDSEKFSRIMSESGGQKSSIELQGALLTARTIELEAEIKKFRKENKNITRIREQWQARLNELEDSKVQHEQLKDREFRLLEEEKRRVARKKADFHELLREYERKYQELNVPTKNTTTEILALNQKIVKFQVDIQSKSAQFAKAQNKLKGEMAALKAENAELAAQNADLAAEIKRLREASTQRPDQQSVQTSTSTISMNMAPVSSGDSALCAVRTNTEEPVYTMPLSPSLTAYHTTNPASANPSQTAVSPAQQRRTTPNEDDEGEERILPNGDREIRYSSGTTKLISKDTLFSRVVFYNGDIRESLRDGSVRYFYNDSSSWHTRYPDGLEVVEFPSGQIERKNPNGVVEISYSNGCIKHIYPCGKEECMFPDRTVLRTEPNGDKVLLLANGQKEYQTKDYRKRLYPDGTVKIMYSDGSHETRHTNGRIRMKNAEGKVIHDAIHPRDS